MHRAHRSTDYILHLIQVERDILIAFNDSQGASMAHRYIIMSLEVAMIAERNNEEIYLLESIAEAESKAVLQMDFLSIKTRLANKLQSQLQHIAYLASTIEFETPLGLASSSSSYQERALMSMNIPQAVSYVACQTRQLLLQQSLISWAIVHTVMIGGHALYTSLYTWLSHSTSLFVHNQG